MIFSFADTASEKYQFGKAVYQVIDELTRSMHTIVWMAVQGNPACRVYDRMIKRYHGRKLVVRDAHRDKYGEYHDDYIYEILV